MSAARAGIATVRPRNKSRNSLIAAVSVTESDASVVVVVVAGGADFESAAEAVAVLKSMSDGRRTRTDEAIRVKQPLSRELRNDESDDV